MCGAPGMESGATAAGPVAGRHVGRDDGGDDACLRPRRSSCCSAASLLPAPARGAAWRHPWRFHARLPGRVGCFYAIVAAVAQWELYRLVLLSPSMAAASPQCSREDRPSQPGAESSRRRSRVLACRIAARRFTSFRPNGAEGVGGALAMGIRYAPTASAAAGCAWRRSSVAGVIEPGVGWRVIAGFVLVEKLLRRGAWFGRPGGRTRLRAGPASRPARNRR